MPYFTKKQVEEFAKENNDLTIKKGLEPLTPLPQTISQLEKQEDVVGFFWFEVDETQKPGNKIKLCGKSFVRVDNDIYTDDRFALDLYQSQKEKKTVSDVVKERNREQELAKQEPVDKIKLEEQFLKKMKDGK